MLPLTAPFVLFLLAVVLVGAALRSRGQRRGAGSVVIAGVVAAALGAMFTMFLMPARQGSQAVHNSVRRAESGLRDARQRVKRRISDVVSTMERDVPEALSGAVSDIGSVAGDAAGEFVGAVTDVAEDLVNVRAARAPSVPRQPVRVSGPPWVWTAMSIAALGVMVFLAHLFLDSGTRGQFTWTLRIFSVVAFTAVCVAVVLLHPRF